MGILTQLDAVNSMLGLLGEAPVNTLSTTHPLVSKALANLRTASAREQAKGWWFNTELVTLAPTSDGEIILPAEVLQLDPTDPALNYAQRGRRLYNLSPGMQSPYKFARPVDVSLVRLLDFEDLPMQAQTLVQTAAQLDFLTDEDGDADKMRLLSNKMRDALVLLNTEHIRAKDVNLLRTASVMGTLNRITGGSSGLLRIR